MIVDIYIIVNTHIVLVRVIETEKTQASKQAETRIEESKRLFTARLVCTRDVVVTSLGR